MKNQYPDHVLYLGNIVPKKGFRTFVYNSKGEKKLVESWGEYEKEVSSGVWFSELKITTDETSKKPKKKVTSDDVNG